MKVAFRGEERNSCVNETNHCTAVFLLTDALHTELTKSVLRIQVCRTWNGSRGCSCFIETQWEYENGFAKIKNTKNKKSSWQVHKPVLLYTSRLTKSTHNWYSLETIWIIARQFNLDWTSWERQIGSPDFHDFHGFQKKLKKCLTKSKRHDIVNKLSARDKLLTTNDRNLDN